VEHVTETEMLARVRAKLALSTPLGAALLSVPTSNPVVVVDVGSFQRVFPELQFVRIIQQPAATLAELPREDDPYRESFVVEGETVLVRASLTSDAEQAPLLERARRVARRHDAIVVFAERCFAGLWEWPLDEVRVQ
jgi:hypothetical protein